MRGQWKSTTVSRIQALIVKHRTLPINETDLDFPQRKIQKDFQRGGGEKEDKMIIQIDESEA